MSHFDFKLSDLSKIQLSTQQNVQHLLKSSLELHLHRADSCGPAAEP